MTPVANFPPPAANLALGLATLAANFSTSFASVVNTGGKFATGVTDTGGKFTTGLLINWHTFFDEKIHQSAALFGLDYGM